MFYKVNTSEGISFLLCSEGLGQLNQCLLGDVALPPCKLTNLDRLITGFRLSKAIGLPVDKLEPHIEDINDSEWIEII